jgi:hypothetical protein
MNAFLSSAALLTILLAAPAFAQETAPAHRNGEHPAVIVKRNYDKQGYDYASKFYPHPAWLYVINTPKQEAEQPDVAAAGNDRAPVTAANTAGTPSAARSIPR